MSIQHNGEQVEARQIANMRRLVACWNACQDVDTETLEAHPAPFTALTKELDAYAKAADTMAAAHKVERDALKDAARLALVFVEHVWRDVSLNEYSEDLRFKIEAALRAAL